MAELYANLPGFTVDYKDRGLVVPQTTVTTDKVVLIGTATDGPKYEPTMIISPNEDAELTFGKAYDSTYKSNNTTLMLGASEAYGAGCRNIALVRVGGSIASANLTVMTLESIYAGSLYNGVQYKIVLTTGSEKFYIKKPTVKGGETMEFTLGTKTIATLVDEINNHADNNVIVATVTTGHDTDVAKVALTATPPYGSYTTTFAAANSNFTLTSKATPGSDVTITLVKPAEDAASTTVAVSNKDITVTLKTTDSAIVATATEVVDAIVASTDASALVEAALAANSSGVGVVEALVKTNLVSAPTYVALTSGTDGPATSVLANYTRDMYKELYTAYGILEDYDADIVVPLGVFADYEKTIGSVTTNFGEQLANFCVAVTERNSETHGIISMSPTSVITQAGIKARVKAVSDRTNFYYKLAITTDDTDENFFTGAEYIKNIDTDDKTSIGHFISVVAMPEGNFNNNVIGSYFAPITAAYAGMISALPVESAPTNKAIPNVRRLRYKLSPSQLDLLTGKNYVTFKEINRSVLVTDACTACEMLYDTHGNITFRSDYWRLSTLRTVFKAVSEVRRVAEPFIGEPNGLPQQASLDTAIRSALNAMKPDALTNYNFTISATLAQKISGDSYIDLELVPNFERRRIRIRVALRTS